ncbi:MAG TPA: hypothetical protein PK340_01790 [Bacilli bacterium]|nr:hypothetical protein [Bacilli bacterium]
MKLTTPVKTITYMALMAALNVTFAFIASLVPLAGLFLAIALPLASALVVLKTDVRYYPIYAMATLGLSLVVALQQLEVTIFYVVPSLLLGFSFGYLYKLRVDDISIIIVSSLLQLIILYATIGLINAIFMIDFVSSLTAILNIDSATDMIIMPSILYVVSLAQVTISYFIIGHEIEKLAPAGDRLRQTKPLVYWLGLCLTIAIVPLGLVVPELSFVLLGLCFILLGSAIYDLILMKRLRLLAILGAWLIASVFANAVLYPLFQSEVGLLWLSLGPLGAITIRVCEFYLPLSHRNHKIKPRGHDDPIS